MMALHTQILEHTFDYILETKYSFQSLNYLILKMF